MSTTIIESTLVPPRPDLPRAEAAAPADADAAWRPLYRAGGIAALLSVAIVVAAIPVYIVSPPPANVVDWFALFHKNALLGLLDFDMMMIVGVALSGLVYFALYGALRRANRPLMALGTIIGFVSIATYIASNTAFNMLVLSNQYAAATTAAQRAQIEAAGQATLAIWQGTAYDVSYVLGGVAALIIAGVMLRSAVFSKATAYLGLMFGAMMLVPGTAGPIGLVLAFGSLLPMVAWDILVARRLFQLASRQNRV